MKRLSAYLDLVDKDIHVDAWYDFFCLEAIDLASQFDRDEWQALTNRVVSLSPVSQEKCLYTIGDTHPICAFRICLLLLRMDDKDVFYRALETMAYCIENMKVTKNDLAILKEFEMKILETPAAERFYEAITEKIEALS